MQIAIIYASQGDLEHLGKIEQEIKEFGIPVHKHLASAHKIPEKVLEILDSYNQADQPTCFITIAGRSNGLSGLVAANTHFPVIACPPFKDQADYLTNIHSSLQMPSDTPALTVIDTKNAALAAVKILGLLSKEIQDKIKSKIIKTKKQFNQD